MADVRVMGAGIVGLAVAEELLVRGHRVEVVDPAPGTGASYAAAGMLSPVGELWHGEEALHALSHASLKLWPAYAERLGVPLRHGTVLVGADSGDMAQIDRRLALARNHAEQALELERTELVEREPGLGRMLGGAWLPAEASVDPRAVVAALRERVSVSEAAPAKTTDVTVWATGTMLPEPYRALVRGVRGEILRLALPSSDLPRHTVRAWVHGEQVYVVPRDSGEVVVGATQEEHDAPPVVSAEAVWRLLDSARRLLPALDRAIFVEAVARDRPGTADNLPLIGPTGEPGVLLAAGHFRHGVLLAPLTARLIADQIETGRVDRSVDPRRMTAKTGGRS